MHESSPEKSVDDPLNPTLSEKLELGEMRNAEYGPIRLDLASRTLAMGDAAVLLSPTEYQIVWMLVRAQGNSITDAEFYNFLKDADGTAEPKNNSIEVYIVRIRRKLQELTGGAVMIENQQKRGYRLVLHPET